MRRNVFILHHGDVVATIPVELDKEAESDFVAEALRHALVHGTFRGLRLGAIEFKVSAPLDAEKSPTIS